MYFSFIDSYVVQGHPFAVRRNGKQRKSWHGFRRMRLQDAYVSGITFKRNKNRQLALPDLAAITPPPSSISRITILSPSCVSASGVQWRFVLPATSENQPWLRCRRVLFYRSQNRGNCRFHTRTSSLLSHSYIIAALPLACSLTDNKIPGKFDIAGVYLSGFGATSNLFSNTKSGS